SKYSLLDAIIISYFLILYNPLNSNNPIEIPNKNPNTISFILEYLFRINAIDKKIAPSGK
ncbi:hypothetical protein, partial [uncultured Parvimonas sp.]|uniref:hypothetical protein n=1 Tax=uncultured Parvimonas sp. TaxID=747372 RepID=UPI0025920064